MKTLWMLSGTSSQCNSLCSMCDKPWLNLHVPVTRRAAEFSQYTVQLVSKNVCW